MKGPEQLAGLRIPAADVAIRPGAGSALAVAASGDHDVAEHRRRRLQYIALVRQIAPDALFQIQAPLVAESRRRLAGGGIEREQKRSVAGKHPRMQGWCSRPIGEPAQSHRRRIIFPKQLARFGHQRIHAVRGRHIHHALHDDGHGFRSRLAGAKAPGGS